MEQNENAVGGGNGEVAAAPQGNGRRSRRRGRDRAPAPRTDWGSGGGRAVFPDAEANFFAWVAERPVPSRGDLEQEAARELQEAATPSLDLLVATVPGAHSPEEAYRNIETNLGEKLDDPDPVLPSHPQWSDDTLVYYHLRRHFGETTGTLAHQGRRPAWRPLTPFPPLQ
jgi:hypothetical protein